MFEFLKFTIFLLAKPVLCLGVIGTTQSLDARKSARSVLLLYLVLCILVGVLGTPLMMFAILTALQVNIGWIALLGMALESTGPVFLASAVTLVIYFVQNRLWP